MTGCRFPRACRRSLCPRLAAWPAPLTVWVFRSSSSCLPTNKNPLMTRSAEGMPPFIPERCAQARQRPQSRQSKKSVAPSSERKELKENWPLTPSTKGKELRGNRQGLSEQQRRQKSQSRQPRHPQKERSGRRMQKGCLSGRGGAGEWAGRCTSAEQDSQQERNQKQTNRSLRPESSPGGLMSSSTGKYRYPSRDCIILASKVACRHSCSIEQQIAQHLSSFISLNGFACLQEAQKLR